MKRGGSGGRRVAAVLFCAAAAFAQEKDVEGLRAKARAEYEGQKPAWERFVFDAAALSDDELEKLTDSYDPCLDLYQRIAEGREEGDDEADVVVIQLARRTAKLRATTWGREMAGKAKAAANKAKPPEAPRPEEKPDEPPAPPPNREPETPEPPRATEPAPPEPASSPRSRSRVTSARRASRARATSS